MTRCFYPASRAHHACCMAIDHGMKFKTTKGGIWNPEGLLHIPLDSNYQIEVAEESLHLLEPRVGDIVTHIGMGFWLVLRVDDEKLYFSGGDYARKREVKIIQRDGTPFHWPESEAA